MLKNYKQRWDNFVPVTERSCINDETIENYLKVLENKMKNRNTQEIICRENF